MNNADTLRYARNILLKLHKLLIDAERAGYERLHGELNAGQYLNVLLEDQNFAWLRQFSMLIVEIDEMFDLKDGVSDEMVEETFKRSVSWSRWPARMRRFAQSIVKPSRPTQRSLVPRPSSRAYWQSRPTSKRCDGERSLVSATLYLKRV